jgi:5'-3' exonuclease
MGVPGFFLWLMKKYNNTENKFIFEKEKLDNNNIFQEINNLDYLMIDCNCLLHPTCFKVLAEFNKSHDNNNMQSIDSTTFDKLENTMINECIKYIQHIIDYAKVKKTIYIAIDGVAPVAKIKQQRLRRFKTVSDKKLWDKIKQKHNIKLPYNWNNSAITPGTKFMIKLHKALLVWIEQFNLQNKNNIIYSSCFTPMEGEHKLLQYIRNLKNNNNFSYLFYGLDADLIFLALSTNLNNIYLLREATEFNANESIEVFKYVSIDIMKNNIFNTFSAFDSKDIKLNKENIIKDFIFICYFLGNDFLPHILSTDIHNNGLDIMIKNYMKTLLVKHEYIIDFKNNTINKSILFDFLQNISLEEPSLLLNMVNKKKKRFSNGSTEYEHEIYKIENLMFKINDPIGIGLDNFENYRVKYYKHYWNLEDNEIEEFSKKLVFYYMEGINWVTLYYFDKCPSWEWYYPFDYPPFITDIVRYFPKTNITFNNNNNDSALNPYMQLLAVLPKQSSYLLPKGLAKLMDSDNSSLTYLYPLEFEQDFINKTRYWMGIPKLPPLNIPLIKHIFEKYKDDLTKEELVWIKPIDIYL